MNSKPPAPAADAPPGSAADDALVDELVAHAVDLVRDRVAPEDLPDFEGALYAFYETSPAAAQLLEQLREAPRVTRSGPVAKSGDEALAEAFVRTSRTGGRRQ